MVVMALVMSLAACGTPGTADTTETTTDDVEQTSGDTGNGNADADTDASGDPIKIGLTTVLTGDRSLEGEYASNVVKIIEEEINSAGGVLGRPIKIEIEDAQGNDIGAVTAYKKLADDPEIVAIIGADSSNDNLAVAPLAEEYQILTCAQGSSPTLRDVCEANPWIFQIRACDSTLVDALMKYVAENFDFKRYGIVNQAETSSIDQANLFKEALLKYQDGLEPVVEVQFQTGTNDFTAQIAQLQGADLDCVVGAGFPETTAILMTQLRASMGDIPVLGNNAFADPVAIRLAGSNLDGAMAAVHYVPSTNNPKGRALGDKYREMFGEECGKSAAQVYDAISIICAAIEIAGSTDRAAVRDAMNTIDDFNGVMTDYDCTTNGDCGRGGLLVQVEDGESVVIGNISAGKKADN